MAYKRKKSVASLLRLFGQKTSAVGVSQGSFGSYPKRSKVCNNANNNRTTVSTSIVPNTSENAEETISEEEFFITGQNSMRGFCNESNEAFSEFPTNLQLDSNSSSVLPRNEKLKVVIIGAGISGLGAAVVLEMVGADVTVLEAASQPGGRMKSIHFPKKGKLEAVSVDTGANILTDCSDANSINLLYSLAQFLGMKTMEVSGAINWDSPLAAKMINLKGKMVDPRIVAKMFYLQQAILSLGMMKIIRDSGFDIPDSSFAMRQKLMIEASKESPPKTKKRKTKTKSKVIKSRMDMKATVDVPNRGCFDFGDGEIEDVMEDTFTKLSIRDIIDYGKQEYKSVRNLSLSAEAASVLECIFTRLYGNILPLDLQNGWDLAYSIHGPLIGSDDLIKQIEGPSEQNVSNLVKTMKGFLNVSKKTVPSYDEVIIDYPEDRLICDSASFLIDYLASKVNILYNKQCQFVHYKDYGVAVDCTDGGVWQSFDADFCIITVPPCCLKEGVEGTGLQISPQMSRAKSAAIKRISTCVGEIPCHNKVILRFDKIFWEPNIVSVMNPEKRVSILNYHKVGKENVLCIQIWANSDWNMIHFSDEDLCAECCEMLKRMYPRTYKASIKLVNWAVSRWNEDPLVRCSSTGLTVGSTSNDFVLFGIPLPSVENPRVCFAGEATIDVLNGPIQTAHGAFFTGVREARRIANRVNLRGIPGDNGLIDLITAESDVEEEIKTEKDKEPVKAVDLKATEIRHEAEAHSSKQCTLQTQAV